MPQEIRVLCCFKCKMYQVDIVKKTNKWQCKMCQEKQSVFKEFFRGSGVDCRLKVQELNLRTNNERNSVENEFLSILSRDDLDIDLETIVKEKSMKCYNGQLKKEDSKWAKYVDPQHKEQHIDQAESSCSKLKRKTNSTSPAADFQCVKNPRLLTFKSSKWNKYL